MKAIHAAALSSIVAMCGAVQAAPVVYTLSTVADGQLGTLTFTQAPVVLTWHGDTGDVSMTTSGGAVSYRIDKGYAVVAVTVQGNTSVASIDPGQLYVHYDVQKAVVGFGSDAVGPDYPAVLSCGTGSAGQCTFSAGSGSSVGVIVSAVADVLATQGADSSFYSAQALALPRTLLKSTVSTGYLNACAVPYFSQAGMRQCASPPAAPFQTSLGNFYLQDEGNAKGVFTADVRQEDD